MIETLQCTETDRKNFEGDLSSTADVYRAASLMAQGRAVAVDNSAVWAVWGDANDHRFISEAQTAKQRDPNKTFGLTLPSHQFLDLVDNSELSDEVRELVSDSEYFANLLGGFVFVRAPANIFKLAEISAPHSAVSICYETYEAKIQNFDPIFSPRLVDMLAAAADEKAVSGGPFFLPAVTSLNPSGDQELVHTKDAVPFARDKNMPIVTNRLAQRKSLGSFPIIEIGQEIVLKRKGNISEDILKDILHDMPYSIDSKVIERSSCAQPYELPFHLRGLKGLELSTAIKDDLFDKTHIPSQRT